MSEPKVPSHPAPAHKAAEETRASSPPQHPPAGKHESNAGCRNVAAKLLSILIIVVAVFLTLHVWHILERHPRTDDASVRANVVGIAPRVRGQIVKLHVQDNQLVNQGDPLFEIDPDDYELTLERAKSALATLDEQIEVARAQDTDLKLAVKVAEAGVERANAQFTQAGDTLRRLEPLLPKGFATAEQVDLARTAKQVAASSLAAEIQRLNQAKAAVSTLDSMIAQRPGAVAAMKLAALELSYCKVTAPFPGRVINLNISAGGYASAGMPVFSLLDSRRWYVMANFREGELGHIAPGAPAEVYLSAFPKRRFHGVVQGIGWAVKPEGEIDLPHDVPYIKRELNWVHIAQRFPVRIEIEQPDPDLFRMGASAVVTIRSDAS